LIGVLSHARCHFVVPSEYMESVLPVKRGEIAAPREGRGLDLLQGREDVVRNGCCDCDQKKCCEPLRSSECASLMSQMLTIGRE
jgi:hypothetical protein